jgi:hypothetical protein
MVAGWTPRSTPGGSGIVRDAWETAGKPCVINPVTDANKVGFQP